jgi:tetratricopeptide (TPR) repeat protein
MVSLLFLVAFHNDEAFTPLCGLASALGSLAKPSPFSRAKAMTTDTSVEAHIEMHLGEVATGREQYEEALPHYQRAAELAPEYSDSWTDLAKAYERLDNLAEAEANYRHAIELEPDNADLYLVLSKMYSAHGQHARAIEAIEEAVSANPDSAILCVYLASMYLENKDYRQAEIFLDKAEQLDPELGMVSMFREVLRWEKAQSAPKIGKLSGPQPKKKKRKR